MLSLAQKVAFLVFALFAGAIGVYSWSRLFRRIARGQKDTDLRFDRPLRRLSYSLATTITQHRTFRKRPVVSFFHSFIFYGFAFYLLVNLVDAAEGYFPFTISSGDPGGAAYNLLADIFSALVLVGVIALAVRRFVLPSRRDFTFNERTILHPSIQHGTVRADSLIVSIFIFVHVGSRLLGAGAKLAQDGPDRLQPFANFISFAFTSQNAHAWREVSYWGALGSVLIFLAYFPRSKHIHIFLAPAKYAFARRVSSGVLPAVALDMDTEERRVGASRLEDLAWPRLLDAYACIQCNRCQDVCPATATGKALSPSALEINKRMELNELAHSARVFESGAPSPRPLLSFALSMDAVWGCTTCGACLEVCPVQDEPMLDIIDIRRQQVMMEGAFPSQLQTAFRGMERSKNPWGINHESRLNWAEGLNVRTIDEVPDPDVLFWVGCAASYDPQSQKTARAFVKLLNYAGVDFAVLGKRECCTGDTARRAGNEYLYRQLADQNISTLNEIHPKLIVATCPHCMNAIGNEYVQIGGKYRVMHHTQYLESLVSDGRLQIGAVDAQVAFHDPCYLGRHNGVYDAPRNLLNVVSNNVVELDRNRDNSFCCGAGGAQFWKEEEPGDQRISENRYIEAERKLVGDGERVLAVGCPFCKSTLQSATGKGLRPVAIKDIAELLLEGVETKLRRSYEDLSQPVIANAAIEANADATIFVSEGTVDRTLTQIRGVLPTVDSESQTNVRDNLIQSTVSASMPTPTQRKKWMPKRAASQQLPIWQSKEVETIEPADVASQMTPTPPVERKKWTPKAAQPPTLAEETNRPEDLSGEESFITDCTQTFPTDAAELGSSTKEHSKRKAWEPKRSSGKT